jgi:hypothetical protein
MSPEIEVGGFFTVTGTSAFRVLSLDGGGMRGTYTATYLELVASTFAMRRNLAALDVGASFDLIVGTSTGAIVACALAAGVPLPEVVDLYAQHGPAIFRHRLPTAATLALDLVNRPRALAAGTRALRSVLADKLGTTSLAEIYERRGIALAITAVEMSQHRAWIFKTPHLAGTTNHRDDRYTLVDVCLATSAAPVYRSLAAVDYPGEISNGYNVFVDGGLWANNPVLVALIEALDLTRPGQQIDIYCLGTCPIPAGEQISNRCAAIRLRQYGEETRTSRGPHLQDCAVPKREGPRVTYPVLGPRRHASRGDQCPRESSTNRRRHDQQSVRLCGN